MPISWVCTHEKEREERLERCVENVLKRIISKLYKEARRRTLRMLPRSNMAIKMKEMFSLKEKKNRF